MNDENFIKKLCEDASLRGQAQAYDFALFLIEMHGSAEAVLRIAKKREEAEERRKKCLL